MSWLGQSAISEFRGVQGIPKEEGGLHGPIRANAPQPAADKVGPGFRNLNLTWLMNLSHLNTRRHGQQVARAFSEPLIQHAREHGSCDRGCISLCAPR